MKAQMLTFLYMTLVSTYSLLPFLVLPLNDYIFMQAIEEGLSHHYVDTNILYSNFYKL